MLLNWAKLGFSFLPVNGFAQVDFKDDQWGKLHFVHGLDMKVSVATNALHYGQACFEGLKAFTTQDSKIALFRPKENHRRMMRSAERLCMVSPAEELFLEAIELAISKNREFVPPYGLGASLYVRPLLIGTESMIGISPSSTYRFIVMVTPVGPYYKNGFKPIKARIVEEYDRAAPRGTGSAKIAGNYAAGLIANLETKKQGLDIDLYTDSIEHKYIDEFTTSNFIGITEDQGYHTPDSKSILESITNNSLQQIAQTMGLIIHRRKIRVDELNIFHEVGACGTAAMITPVCSIQNATQKWLFDSRSEADSVLTNLYNKLISLQYGEVEDKYNWLDYLPF